MADPQKSTLTFNLVIDEDRCHVLQLFFSVLEHGATPAEFFKYLGKNNLVECYESFAKDAETKQHKLGWCKDPECQFNFPTL